MLGLNVSTSSETGFESITRVTRICSNWVRVTSCGLKTPHGNGDARSEASGEEGSSDQRRTFVSFASLPLLAAKRYRAPFSVNASIFSPPLSYAARAISFFIHFSISYAFSPLYTYYASRFFYLFLQLPLPCLLLPRNPLINAQTFYHHITNQSPFFVELLFVRKLLLVDLKLRCIRPDFDDFRSENVKSANHRPVFPSKLEYRPLIGWKTGVRIALTLLLLRKDRLRKDRLREDNYCEQTANT